MSVVVLIFGVIRGYDKYKILVFFLLTLFKSIEAFSDVLYGILQKENKLDLVGKSLFVKSLSSIILFIIVDCFTKNIVISIVSIIAVWMIYLLLYDFRKTNDFLLFKEKVNWKNVFIIFKRGFTTFAIAFLGIYIINAPKYAIDNYLPNNIQTIFGIIVMPATVVSLVAQFLIHPFLNQILKNYEQGKLKEVKIIMHKLICALLLFGIIAAVVAYAIGTQVLGLLYGLDLTKYKIELLTIIIASTLYTIGIIHSSVLTTVRETFSQFIIYIIISIFTLIVSNVFTKNWNLDGAVWAYLATMALQFILYLIYTNVKLKIIFEKIKSVS
jgi:O-antigen/teichoic acid export membrane protein